MAIELRVDGRELLKRRERLGRELLAPDSLGVHVGTRQRVQVPPAQAKREPADRLVEAVAQPDEVESLEALEGAIEALAAPAWVHSAHHAGLAVAEELVCEKRFGPDDLVDGKSAGQLHAAEEPVVRVLAALEKRERANVFGAQPLQVGVGRE